jgi:hypothetical protein
MFSEDERERRHRAYSSDHLKVPQMARETGHCRQMGSVHGSLSQFVVRKEALLCQEKRVKLL